jgi:hypothetical protein
MSAGGKSARWLASAAGETTQSGTGAGWAGNEMRLTVRAEDGGHNRRMMSKVCEPSASEPRGGREDESALRATV